MAPKDAAYETIRLEVEDRIATITLDRPERMNAFVWRMGAELIDAYDRCDADDEVRAVILTGAGRAFCAGADMAAGEQTFRAPEREEKKEASGSDEARERPRRREIQAFRLRKPVIAALNGHAVGVGLTMALQCDVRYVAEDAKLAFAFVRRGILPELGSHVILPRVVGLSNAAELLLSGRTITGREAVDYGLATRALPAAEVLPAARALAADIAANAAPVSVALSKRLLWEGLTDSAESMMAKEARLFAWLGHQPDAAEGVLSYVQKRPPEWKLSPSKDWPEWPQER